MCHRRQKSWSDRALYGRSKFCGNWKPRSLATPIAMSVYPLKSA
jgi:hypothetical protein